MEMNFDDTQDIKQVKNVFQTEEEEEAKKKDDFTLNVS